MQERQKQIMQALVEAYIDSGDPVSSGFLSRHFEDFWSPATMRNDLADLLRQGYVKKIYCSSGNVPTNKAYRFFVETVLDLMHVDDDSDEPDVFHSFEDAARFMTEQTGTMNVLIDEDLNMALDGVEELFGQPDFSTRDEYRALARMIDEIQDRRHELFRALFGLRPSVYVGSVPVVEAHGAQTSAFGAGVRTADGTRVVTLLIGPERMPYRKNWNTFCITQQRLAKSKPQHADAHTSGRHE